jgi:hypothetical protein
VPHPFRFFLRKGWDANNFLVYTISENALSAMTVVMVVSRSHQLRLPRDRSREAENSDEPCLNC